MFCFNFHRSEDNCVHTDVSAIGLEKASKQISEVMRMKPYSAIHVSGTANYTLYRAGISLISIILKLYSPRYPVNITFSRGGRSAKSYFSCVVYHVLARYSILFGVHA